MTKSDKIITLDKENPALTNAQIADMIGCSKRLVRKIRNTHEAYEKRMPKILIFDIETSPMEVLVWGTYKQRIGIEQILKDWSLLSWSAKWLFHDEIMSQRVSGKEAIERKDGSIVKGLWNLMDEADLLVGHNAQRFDVRKANLRFALNELPPPQPYRVIDTMKHAMKVFNSSSYKLDYLNEIFGGQNKMHAPYQLWKDSIKGDNDALKAMEEYNRFDITVTEELYVKLRPWMKGHPNLALYMDTDGTVCTNCGNDNLEWGGYYMTPAGKYKSFRCNTCGAIGRSRFSDLDKEARAKLLLSIAS
jgi:DNA polymerase elongation subunit (family B)